MGQGLRSKNNQLKIAVVGSGIAGMSSAWLLSKKHNITVFESEDRIGGHSNTINLSIDELNYPVDTGFIVYNDCNYPNLVKLFDYLKVPTKPSTMSFSVSQNSGRFEFGSRGINALVGQRSNLLDYNFIFMIKDILRFFKNSEEFLRDSNVNADISLGEFLSTNNYKDFFINRFILPMGAAIWSTYSEKILLYPAVSFLRFFRSHGLLGINSPINWRTVDGGSREYIKRLTSNYSDKIRLSSRVKKIFRIDKGVELLDEEGNREQFDEVVIATHADQALTMLADPDQSEKNILGAFLYTSNKAIVHSDEKLMPKRKRVWSSWNYMGSAGERASITYWMNLLQTIKINKEIFVSINPIIQPDHETVYSVIHYQHPFFDAHAWKSQSSLWSLQGRRNTWYCGSYFGYGFHEDALQAGLAVAEELGGIKRPWDISNDSSRIIRKINRL